MALSWTTEQVLALSPDDKSTKNGKSLANTSKWQTLGFNGQVTWGECKGSGKKPYRTQIDLSEPAFRCSCPSRKFPCKHAIGLFLLLAGQSASFNEDQPPDWVEEWLTKRSQTAQAKVKKEKPADSAAQAKRIAQREAKVQAGLADLDLWLRDIIRQGLAALQTRPYSFWDQQAARMVDAQAPGLARRLREMAGIPHLGQDWPQLLLTELGKLHLLIQGYQRLESLPAAVQAELRSQIGWSLKQEELLTQAEQPDSAIETVQDTWYILGKSVTDEDSLKVQRVWLRGSHGRFALILSFVFGSQPLDTSLIPGATVDAELVFYPGLVPLRAVVKQRQISQPSATPKGGLSIAGSLEHCSNTLSQNPWLSPIPMLLTGVIPFRRATSACLVDEQEHQLPLNESWSNFWEMLALSGGHPLTVFGEWDGQRLLPLSFWANDRMYS